MEKQLNLWGEELPSSAKSLENTLKLESILNSVISVIAVVYPLTAIPQLFEIWINRNVDGISIITWGMFLLFTLPIMVYCLLKKEMKLVLMYAFWLVIYVAVISGVMIYS
tara:strand:+ start:255 stop:584 length:330 start_codon:yes stop_codon:yes gene_type:complete